ncbi:hypothetical protein BDV06DRAFT_189062 [Aspergillus oleicola]
MWLLPQLNVDSGPVTMTRTATGPQTPNSCSARVSSRVRAVLLSGSAFLRHIHQTKKVVMGAYGGFMGIDLLICVLYV